MHSIVRMGWEGTDGAMQRIIEYRLADDLGDGVRDLDRDHADMMSLAAQVSRLTAAGQMRQASAVLRELLCAAEAHWQREEAMLRAYGYPNLDQHTDGHRQTEEILSGMLVLDAGADTTTCADVVLRMLIDDHHWKWWFLDGGIRPGT